MRRATLTFAEVAAIYGTGVKRVREAARSGELPTTRLAGKIFILRKAVEEQLGICIDLPDEREDSVE